MAEMPSNIEIMPNRATSSSTPAAPTVADAPPRNGPENPLVVALAYDGLCTFEFGVAVELFGLSRPEMGPGWYRFAVAAIDAGPLRATGGVQVVADGGPDLIAEAGTVIVPGWRGTEAPVPETLIAALRTAHGRGCRLMSICSGFSCWPPPAFWTAGARPLTGAIPMRWRRAIPPSASCRMYSISTKAMC